jgi:hypothetical protein
MWVRSRFAQLLSLSSTAPRHSSSTGNSLRQAGLGDRSIGEDVLLAIADEGIEPVLAAIDPREDGGGERRLKAAAHVKAFVGAPDDAGTASLVLGEKADPAADRPLVLVERYVGRLRCPKRARGPDGERRDRG